MVKLPQTCSNLSAKIYLLQVILLVVNGFGNLNYSSLLVANEFDIEKKKKKKLVDIYMGIS